MRRIALFGSKGLLGSAFLDALADFDVVTIENKDFRHNGPYELSKLLDNVKPSIVLNCAAHTDLEAAERGPAIDYTANAELPQSLAGICKGSGATLVHFSSTGCYGNWKTVPYTEADHLRPTTKHHQAKRDGEEAIQKSGCAFLILRLGWLYGGAPGMKKNFVWNRLIEASTTTQLKSDITQQGCPTYVGDVVRQTLCVLNAEKNGIFNLTAHGAASRFEYVAEIVKASNLACTVIPGPAFPRLAPVSPNETAVNQKLQRIGLDQMDDWRVSLNAYVQALMLSREWRAR